MARSVFTRRRRLFRVRAVSCQERRVIRPECNVQVCSERRRQPNEQWNGRRGTTCLQARKLRLGHTSPLCKLRLSQTKFDPQPQPAPVRTRPGDRRRTGANPIRRGHIGNSPGTQPHVNATKRMNLPPSHASTANPNQPDTGASRVLKRRGSLVAADPALSESIPPHRPLGGVCLVSCRRVV